MPMRIYVPAFGIGTTLVLLVVHQLVQRVLAPSMTLRREVEQGSFSRALLQVGHVFGVFLVSASTVANCVEGQSFARDVAWAAAFGGMALVLLSVTGHLGVKLLLKHELPAEIARGNVAAGLAAGAHYVATGIITSRAIAGNDVESLGLSLAFFCLAQLTLHAFIIAFRALTTYDDAEEIRGENVAASLSYSGLSIAVALIIGRAVEGNFAGWWSSLRSYGAALQYNVALYLVRQIVVQTILLGAGFSLRGGALDDGVGKGRSLSMGVLEASTYVAAALAATRL